MRARPGDAIAVRLEENPTTGYRWVVTAGLAPSGDTFFSGRGGIGSGGERILTFRVDRPMKTRVSAVLRREWETDAEPQARFDVIIHAQ
ncbi:protease inhibitor I42 family protein [Solirhodobacter olei]|uniref:protease inhibitor I42 family protein n=1 Tax=Solirhodobacter olei TaxID=2493082 RepID=UPI003BAA4DA2